MKHFILILGIGLLLACNSEKKEEPNQVDISSNDEAVENEHISEKPSPYSARTKKTGKVDNQYEVILDSVHISWERLLKDENQRLEDIKRLLLEVSYLPGATITELNSMKELSKELKTYIYQQNNLPSFDVVSNNDVRIDEIIAVIFTFCNNSLDPNKSYPLIEQLKIDIQLSLKETSFLNSNDYSQHVLDRNNYIEINKEALQELGYTNLEPLNSFFASTNI